MLPRKGRVIDLGCCPGSWSQYLRRNAGKQITLVGIDISEVLDYPGTFIHASALKVSGSLLREALDGEANLVMSDMAPNTQGHRFTDHIRQIELARAALRIARETLHPGGDFITKVFDGEEAHAFVMEVRKHFGKVRRIKPKATRNESVEFFVVARGFRTASRLRPEEDALEGGGEGEA